MNHLGTVKLETERLILRPFCMNDADDMFQNWAGNDAVTRYLTWPTHTTAEVSKHVIEFWIKGYEDKNKYEWCIEYKGTGQAIGDISVVNVDDAVKAAEMGYCIGETFWHRGITTEALKQVMEFLFNEVGFNRVWSKHDSRNPNSGKVMERAGLIYEGTHRAAGINNAGICDTVVHGLTKKEYKGENE